MMAMGTLMNLKYFARRGLWQHFIWMKRSGALMFNRSLVLRQTLRYNTFTPDSVKKMPKSDLVEEIWRLQATVREQTEITEFSQQEFERLQNEKILCRVCFEEQINIVLLPCRHHVLRRYSYLSNPINTAKDRSFWLSRALSEMINALIYLLNLRLRHHNFSCMYFYGNYLQNCNLCLMTMHNITFIIKGCGIMHSFLSD
ncbi:hypothetical protein J1N35_026169 [Gossypium stocksii]|uniref:Uncharacterized protein n=1 Tax=Gossypium stocksii TaxID=47602 RepID=A0A9D3V8C3_9ROSI|nr:hypothetical protein J1N35_026169 [Gossypium stocksii]